MNREDSESSDDEFRFTTSSILLGYASKEPTEDPFNQLGGLPVLTYHFH